MLVYTYIPVLVKHDSLTNFSKVAVSSICVTITIEVCTNGATTLSRMNFSGYLAHVTIFS